MHVIDVHAKLHDFCATKTLGSSLACFLVSSPWLRRLPIERSKENRTVWMPFMEFQHPKPWSSWKDCVHSMQGGKDFTLDQGLVLKFPIFWQNSTKPAEALDSFRVTGCGCHCRDLGRWKPIRLCLGVGPKLKLHDEILNEKKVLEELLEKYWKRDERVATLPYGWNNQNGVWQFLSAWGGFTNWALEYILITSSTGETAWADYQALPGWIARNRLDSRWSISWELHGIAWFKLYVTTSSVNYSTWRFTTWVDTIWYPFWALIHGCETRNPNCGTTALTATSRTSAQL